MILPSGREGGAALDRLKVSMLDKQRHRATENLGWANAGRGDVSAEPPLADSFQLLAADEIDHGVCVIAVLRDGPGIEQPQGLAQIELAQGDADAHGRIADTVSRGRLATFEVGHDGRQPQGVLGHLGSQIGNRCERPILDLLTLQMVAELDPHSPGGWL